MSHPHHGLTQSQFSPPQASPSPSNATAAGAFSMPPSKRPKVSPIAPPAHSQPNSPYGNSTPYAASPASGTATPTTVTGLPSHALPVNMAAAPSTMATAATSQIPQNTYNPSQQVNGRFNSMTPMTPAQPSHATSPIPAPSQLLPQQAHQHLPFSPAQSPIQTPTPTAHLPSQYSHAQLAPVNSSAIMPNAQTTGNMGPPALHPASSFSGANEAARQPSRPAGSKTTSYEVNDMLMGTGIDLDEEADYMNNLESRTGFAHLPHGSRDSFYGAGPANQPPDPTDAKTQEEYAASTADRTWNEAAHRLAATRSQELRQHLLEPGILHKRMYDVASKFGLGLNVDMKPDGRNQYMGKLASPADFPKPELIMDYRTDADGVGTTVRTTGSFLPKESFLVDQIALLSIGTKQRMRDLLGDAHRIASTRQKSAHGAVPAEWADAAAPTSPQVNGAHSQDARTGAESAVSPRTTPLKRPSAEISGNGLPTPVSETPPPNHLIDTLVDFGKQSQSVEELRLRKRQKRAEKSTENKDGAEAGSRGGSVVPGTPGSIAPEGGDVKALSKKEGKKAVKAAESSSGTTVNATLSLFTGGKKKYSWMNSGAGSGASTPRPLGASGASSVVGGLGAKAGRGPLTKAGVTHLGQFREDSEKGKKIQLRDWIIVLEDRGFDLRTLQEAYDKLDKSDLGDKVAPEAT
ncbi:hypothetical protein F4777DRAFT_532186 [Nemania sp. FL0916]|nr:hypothetical protein F4777DRAFT_532186 [Nemania sp. FL0916]